MNYFWAYFFQSFGIQVCSLSQKCLRTCLFLKFLHDSELPPVNWYFLTMLDRARPCSTVLEVCFNQNRGTFWVCRRPKALSRPFYFDQALTCICFWKPKHKVSNLTWERNPLSSKKKQKKIQFKKIQKVVWNRTMFEKNASKNMIDSKYWKLKL